MVTLCKRVSFVLRFNNGRGALVSHHTAIVRAATNITKKKNKKKLKKETKKVSKNLTVLCGAKEANAISDLTCNYIACFILWRVIVNWSQMFRASLLLGNARFSRDQAYRHDIHANRHKTHTYPDIPKHVHVHTHRSEKCKHSARCMDFVRTPFHMYINTQNIRTKRRTIGKWISATMHLRRIRKQANERGSHRSCKLKSDVKLRWKLL